VPIRLTTQGDHFGLIWSPDSSRLAYMRGDLNQQMFTIAVDGGGQPEQIGDSLEGYPRTWSSDNVLAFYYSPDPGSVPARLWTLTMDGESEPEQFLDIPTRWEEFSPDGRWLAYESIETGRREIYVRPFPAGSPVYRVSNNGGSSPFWSPDGTQLFYVAAVPDERNDDDDTADEPEDVQRPTALMVVDIDSSNGFERNRPEVVFTRVISDTVPVRSLDISPDGERFIIMRPEPLPDVQPVTSVNLVLNWFDELVERVPVPAR
jgi:Tol biopolymer transport system component